MSLLIRGRRLYAELVKKYKSVKTICINQHPGLGDAFISNLYLKQLNDKDHYLITCISNGSIEIFKNSGFVNIVKLTQREIDELISYCHYMGIVKPDVWIMHHQALQWKTGIAWFFQGINGINFHDLMHAMVFPEFEKTRWEPLKCSKPLDLKENLANSIILFPVSNTLYSPSEKLWDSIVSFLKSRGYDLYTYVFDGEKTINNTKSIKCNLSELVNLVEASAGVVAVRNGLVDVFAGANCKKMILYPNYGAESWINGSILNYWSINAFGFSNDAIEVEYSSSLEKIEDDNILYSSFIDEF